MIDRRSFLKQGVIVTAGTLTTSAFNRSLGAYPRPIPQSQDHPFFAGVTALEVIAHRGGNGHWPGETIYAMKRAVERGVDVLEMDVYLTKDKHLVLMHDNHPGSTTELSSFRGRLPVHHFDLAELQRLNAGYEWARQRDAKVFAKKFDALPDDLKTELRVPTLREVFEKFKDKRMNIEMKWAPFHSPAKALSDLINEYGMKEKVLVASMDDSYLDEFRGFNRAVATSASPIQIGWYLLRKRRPNAEAIQLTPEIRIEIKKRFPLLNVPVLQPKHVARAKQDGLHMHVWTINSTQQMREMKSLGVNGIITDYPCRLLDIEGRSKPGKPCEEL